MEVLTDVAAERGVLSGIYKYGGDAYFDVADIISEKTFTVDSNQFIYRCVKTLLEEDSKAKIDLPSIYSVAARLDLSYFFEKPSEVQHLQAIIVTPVALQSVRKFAAVIRKLEVARLLREQLEGAGDELLDIRGTEPIAQILGIAENRIFDFTSLLNGSSEEEPQNLYEGLLEYLTYLADNPVQQIGLKTGYEEYDNSIGGGWRPATINVIGGRAKSGKSTILLNIANYVTKTSNIPVLYLDTELIKEDQIHRLIALLTETDIKLIETGQFGANKPLRNRILTFVSNITEKKIPFVYKNISGMAFEEILAIARRWIVRNVGLNDDGSAKPCLIIYDYLKLMSGEGLSSDMKEYQMLGFMMTGLQNFGVRYKIPIGLAVQLNRDGLNKESIDIAAGSDRISWFCSNFSIYKDKSEEELQQDGPELGNKKLVPLICRHGPGLNRGDYINMNLIGNQFRIEEVGRSFAKYNNDGFVIQDDVYDDTIPFE